jgi:diguanylate cyclase (GGDEF)-like protein/PAS domain S-box-containing protein
MGEEAVSPLWDGRQILGYISVDNYLTQRPITSYQQELLVLFAQTVGNLASRKQIETEIQESEARYRLLADNAFDVIWTMDLAGNFTYISPSIERLRGYSPEEALQQSMADTLTPQSLVVAEQAMQEMLSTIEAGEKYSATPTFELEQYCKDGSTVWTEVITTLIYDHDETPLGILGVTRDISERKITDWELRNYIRHQDMLNKITQAVIEQTDLQDMLQTLADRMGELLNADGCFITLWDERKCIATPVAAYGPFRETYPSIAPPKPGEPTLTEAALTQETVLIIHDVFNTPHLSPRIAAKFPARSGLALPLIANNQKLGAALIAFDEPHTFTQTEINISQQAAQQIALAILKAKLLDEAKQRAKEAETLRLTSATVASTLKEKEAIERILEELNRVVPYDSASVLLMQGTEMEIVGARGFENLSQILGLHFPISAETPNKVVADTRQPYILEDAPKEFEAFRHPPHNHIRGWMGIPLMSHDNLIGMLSLDSKQSGRFTPDHARLASAFADQVTITLENARLFEETRRLAITDSLTNIYNRRHFLELARREFNRAIRYKIPLSVIMLDIDHFKNVNDTYGHLAGDQVLQTTAYICRKNLRSIDIIGRYGGEEFVILLPETPLRASPAAKGITPAQPESLPAEIVAERLRQKIEQTSFEIGENSILIRISLGVAEFADGVIHIENLIDLADRALLQAKSQGRNRVVSWNSEVNLA